MPWTNTDRTTFHTIFLTGILLIVLTSCVKRVPPPPAPIQPVVGSRQIGIASWYGKPFHGRPTASGAIYNMYDLTAAHRTLPLGTQVMVTNLENNRSVKVTINDRGPFVKNRIIDLSYAAAKSIGMVGPGTAKVMVEVLNPTHQKGKITSIHSGYYTLQVASFSNKEYAQRLAARLAALAENVYIMVYKTRDMTYYRVRVGIFKSRESAAKEAKKLARDGYDVIITKYE